MKFDFKKLLYKRMFLWLLCPISFFLVLLAKLNNNWVEHFFLPVIYRPVSYVIGSFVSLFPFSVTELLVVLLFLGLVIYIVLSVKNRTRVYKIFVNAVCVISVALFLFEICMGLNYYRYEASYYLDLDVRERPVSELYDLCNKLIEDLNSFTKDLDKDLNGITVLSDSDRTETSKSARDAYKSLSDEISVLKSADIRNKPLVTSKLFSKVLTTGIYIPYTFESNINVDVPEFTIPATMCHELTHFRGFMRENEANFLGYLACMKSDRIDFKYSGTLMAFGYCYTALYDADKDLAKNLRSKIDNAVISDILYEDEYWAPYRNTVTANVSNQVYDGYLQANNQDSGIASYGEMVDLLLAWFEVNK